MRKPPNRVILRAAAALIAWSLLAAGVVAPVSQVGAVVGTPDALATSASVCEETDVPREVFDDVPLAYVHALNIDCVAFYNISKGSGAGNLFAPERQVTRWEMALFLARTAELVGVLLPSGSSASFNDLEGLPTEATEAIGSLAAAAIIRGRSDQTFDPYSVVTRGQTALLLVRFLSLVATSGVSVSADGKILVNATAPDDFFGDVRGRFPNEFDAATGALFELGITTGVSGARFRPEAAVTRAQMASFLARMFDHTTLVSDVLALAPAPAPTPAPGPVTPPPADLRPLFFGSPTVFVWTEGTQVDAALPSAVGGDPPLTYFMAPAPELPVGLSHDPGANKITGIAPLGAIPEESYTLNVVDSDGDAASTEVRITIAEDVAPQFHRNSSSVEFGTGESVSLQLPYATGGNGDLQYSFSGASPLPGTLEYVPATNRIVGEAPDARVGERTFTLTATDADGDTANFTLRITIDTNTEPKFTETLLRRVYATDQTVELTLPRAQGGNGTVVYSLSNQSQLPGTLAYTASTNTIAGVAPGSPVAERSFTLTATDADGDLDTLDVRIEIATDTAPSFDVTEVVREYGTNKSVSLSLPTATGGNGTLTHALSNTAQLPGSLRYSAAGNSISGVAPGTPVAERTFTLTATDFDGDTATILVRITIATNSSPSFDVTEVVREYGTGRSVSLSLPTASGGNGTVAYSLSNTSNLPGNLTYSAATNLITGLAPGSPEAELTFTLTATDHDGDTATIPVRITIATNSSPSFDVREVVREYGTGKSVSLRLPTASGGNGTVAYSLSNVSNLPGTLAYSAGSNAIAGTTPGDPVREQSFTLTATDSDGDSARLTVKITVATDTSPSFDVTEVVREYGTNKSVSLSLPTATGGNGTLTHALSNTAQLPGSLRYSAAGNSISGVAPGTPVAQRTFTLTATDSDGDTATVAVKITVATNSSPSFGATSEVVREYGTSKSVSLSLPTATGGNGTVSYSLSNESQLPGTLAYSSSSNSIAGTTPRDPVPEGTFTLTAIDADGDTATVTVKISVATDSSPSFAVRELAREYGTNKTVTLSLPTATGGNGTVSYSLSNASQLPGTLDYSAAGNAISGRTGSSAVPERSFTVTATDSDGDTATLVVKITVATNSSPSFGATTEVVREYGTGKTVTLSLPSATGGNGTVTYALSNTSALPGNLTYWPATNTITGTAPATPVAERSFTLTATDDDGETDTVVVRITIDTDSSPSFTTGEISREFGTGKSVSLALPDATGGNGTITYALLASPALPEGLAYSADDHAITGTAPRSPVPEASYVVTATDSDGDISTLTVKIAIATDSEPSFSVNEVVREYGLGRSVSLSLPTASGGNGTVSYSLSNVSQLPGTLAYSDETNTITGTAPTEAVAERSFTLTATDHDGDTDTLTVKIAIAADSAPSFSATEVVRELGTGRSVSLSLPTASGGNGTATYSLSNVSQLPGTLAFSAADNAITGATPSSAVAQRSFTLTATDNDGDTATITVKISVADNSTPLFARTRIDYLFATSEAVDRPLPGASGGNGTVTYTLTGEMALPQNLAFSAALNKISGTASATPVAQRTLTLTATDDDGETATLVVTVAVVTPVDYDTDDDGLIEVKDLAQLNAIRWDLNGDGQVSDADRLDYVLAFGAAKPRMGCNEDINQPSAQVCEGYELTANLDFDSDNDGDVDADDHQGLYWNNGAGWRPIGPYEAIFDGNRRSVSGLFINITGSRPVANAGLFSEISGTAEVRYLSVDDVSITVERDRSAVGALAGINRGKVRYASSSGEITVGATATAGYSALGGLIGWQDQRGTVTPSVVGGYSSVDVTGGSYSGGLVGRNSGARINRSYATGAVRTNGVAGDRYLGGLVGYVWGGGSAVSESYATGSVADTRTRGFVSVGGMVGTHDDGSLTEGYATGAVSGTNSGLSRNFGGLVGRGEASTTDADVYWDSQATTAGSRGIGFAYSSTTFDAKGLTTAELQADTNQMVAAAGYDGVYKDWDHSIWDFGGTRQYPVLVVDFNGDGTATWQEFGTQRTDRAATVANPISDASLSVGGAVAAQLLTPGAEVFDDPDGHPQTYSVASSNQTVATVSLHAGNVVVVRGVANGTADITATSTGTDNLAATDTFTVTVAANLPNAAPQAATPIAPQRVHPGDTITVALETTGSEAFTDPNGDTLTYTATSSATNNITVAVDATNKALNITGVRIGTAEITVTASDGSLTATSVFTAAGYNTAPIVQNALPDLTAQLDGRYVIEMEPGTSTSSHVFVDPDGDTLDYSATTSNGNRATVIVDTIRKTIQVSSVSQGTAEITVTASDDYGGSVSDTFTVTVVPGANRDPSLTNPIPNQSVRTGRQTIVPLEAPGSPVFTDPDGQTLSYRITYSQPHKALATIDEAAKTIVLTGVKAGTSMLVIVRAYDGAGGSKSDEFTVQITSNRTPAFAEASKLYYIKTGATTPTALPSATGGDKGLTYTLTGVNGVTLPGSLSYDAATNTITGTAPTSPVAERSFTLTAADADNDTATMTVKLIVVDNLPPTVANPIADRLLEEGGSATIELETDGAEVFNDADDATLTYSVSSADPTAVAATLTGTSLAVSAVSRGRVVVTVTATDSAGNTADAGFTVLVGNSAPVPATAVEDVAVNIGAAAVKIDLEASGSEAFTDPNGDTLTYTATPANADLLTVDVNGAELSLTGLQPGTTEVTVVASDGFDTASVTFSVGVNVEWLDSLYGTNNEWSVGGSGKWTSQEMTTGSVASRPWAKYRLGEISMLGQPGNIGRLDIAVMGDDGDRPDEKDVLWFKDSPSTNRPWTDWRYNRYIWRASTEEPVYLDQNAQYWVTFMTTSNAAVGAKRDNGDRSNASWSLRNRGLRVSNNNGASWHSVPDIPPFFAQDRNLMITVVAIAVLPPVAGFTADAGIGQVTLSWQDPAVSDISGYQVQYKTADDADWGEWTDISGSSATTTSHVVTGLTSATEYLLRVRPVLQWDGITEYGDPTAAARVSP